MGLAFVPKVLLFSNAHSPYKSACGIDYLVKNYLKWQAIVCIQTPFGKSSHIWNKHVRSCDSWECIVQKAFGWLSIGSQCFNFTATAISTSSLVSTLKLVRLLLICDWICEKWSCTHNYKYLERNIQFIISQECTEQLACISPLIYSHSRPFSG